MSWGEFFTRFTIWLALIGYGFGAAALLRGRDAFARAAWTAGCAFLLLHVLCAFAFHHNWSHAAAYAETARQTAAMTGLRWGGGIYFNYTLAVAWLGDVFVWWFAPGKIARRPRWLTMLWQGFLAFMILNGTIVFGAGPVRWFGVALFGILAWLAWRRIVVRGTTA